MKAPKPLKNSHTPNTKKGQGDYYGTGVKNPIMRPKEIMGVKIDGPKKVKTAPKSMA